MPSICPSVVHSNVVQRRLLDDERVLLAVFLEAILCGFLVFVKLFILKEPGKECKMSIFETCQCYMFETKY